MDSQYFMDNFVIKEDINSFNKYPDKILFDNYCLCDEHLGQKFVYFCDDCEGNLCRVCYTEDKTHITHKIIDFNGNEFKKKINEIEKKIPSLKDVNSSISSENQKKYNNYLKIFREIFEIYEEYPCYNIYRCINNINDFIQKDSNNATFQIIIHKDMKEYFKVRLSRELKKVLEKNKDGDLIKTIRINKKNFKCLNVLSNRDFKSLKLLELSNNNIRDLTPLLNSKFPVLEDLNLSINRIDDDNATKIFKINMPNLKYLNLFNNNLKKYDIFKNIHIFKRLTKLFIGVNKFNKEISEIDENTIYDCQAIKIMGLTRGIFSDESIDLISKFKFQNLQLLYLSCNNLSTLSFIDKLNCKIENLEEIWLVSNNLTEFYPLIKFKNLKKINLKGNRINNIEKLVDFVKHFAQLKLINFEENNIDKNNQINSKIIENAILEGPKTIRIVKKKENDGNQQEPKKEEKIIEKLEITI